MTARQFLPSSTDSRNSVRELLQLIFSAELSEPKSLSLAGIALVARFTRLDNTTGIILSLCPEFSTR